MYPFYLSVDLHLRCSYVVLMNAQGAVLDERHLANSELSQYLQDRVPQETYAVLEATRNWPFMYDLLQAHVQRVELAHPKQLKAISAAAVKTDRIDVAVLAHLARLNYLPTAYAAPKDVRDLRLSLRHRQMLIKQRTRAKNFVHAILARDNWICLRADLFGVAGREWLQNLLSGKQLRSALRGVVQDQLQIIDRLTELITRLEDNWLLTPNQSQQVELLQTVPGIGRLIAVTIVAEIGAIQRFSSAKALCNWAGLTPRLRSSGGHSHYGRISKEGSPLLRGAMTQAAVVAAHCSRRWYVVHENLAQRSGKRIANVAIARRLLTVVYCILTRNQPYQENYAKATDHDREA